MLAAGVDSFRRGDAVFVTMNDIQTYHVFGRKSYPQPLTFVGQVDVEADAGPKEAALKLAGANGWVELVAIPASSITPVIVEGEPV